MRPSASHSLCRRRSFGMNLLPISAKFPRVAATPPEPAEDTCPRTLSMSMGVGGARSMRGGERTMRSVSVLIRSHRASDAASDTRECRAAAAGSMTSSPETQARMCMSSLHPCAPSVARSGWRSSEARRARAPCAAHNDAASARGGHTVAAVARALRHSGIPHLSSWGGAQENFIEPTPHAFFPHTFPQLLARCFPPTLLAHAPNLKTATASLPLSVPCP